MKRTLFLFLTLALCSLTAFTQRNGIYIERQIEDSAVFHVSYIPTHRGNDTLYGIDVKAFRDGYITYEKLSQCEVLLKQTEEENIWLQEAVYMCDSAVEEYVKAGDACGIQLAESKAQTEAKAQQLKLAESKLKKETRKRIWLSFISAFGLAGATATAAYIIITK